jgi:hypothetical protein
MTLVLAPSLTEMITWNIAWGVKAACAYGWQPYHLHLLIIWKSGSHNRLASSGLIQALQGCELSVCLEYWSFLSKLYTPPLCRTCWQKHDPDNLARSCEVEHTFFFQMMFTYRHTIFMAPVSKKFDSLLLLLSPQIKYFEEKYLTSLIRKQFSVSCRIKAFSMRLAPLFFCL